jgi:hypothetical protein
VNRSRLVAEKPSCLVVIHAGPPANDLLSLVAVRPVTGVVKHRRSADVSGTVSIRVNAV